MKTERWCAVKDYVGLYEVSDWGNVKSLGRWVFRKIRGKNIKVFLKEKRLKPSMNRGYGRVVLCRGGSRERFLVHRLVAMAFHPNPENKPEVNHKKGKSNHVSNLEWCTKGENEDHAIKNGLKCHGEKNGRAKLTYEIVGDIRLSTLSHQMAANHFGISKTHIRRIRNKTNWK